MYQQLRQYCMDVALGMAFLEEMKCVHRQLSARNVYVANGKKCKISELGASSAVLEDEEYEVRTKGRLPIRWMALESIQDCVYNTKTDVWSFGIVLWEIFNFGDEPYPEMTVKDVIYELQQGYRMPSSDYSSGDM
ncbi:tyrosine-protein kinase receptor Tie-1-like [Ptychodera flava]